MVNAFSFANEGRRSTDSPKSSKSSQSRQSAAERLSILQDEVNRLQAQESTLRNLLKEVSEKGAKAVAKNLGGLPTEEARPVEEVVEEFNMVANTRKFAQKLQELMGVLKLLERQIRTVERCETTGDMEGFRAGVNEAVNSHNTAAAQCDEMGQLETADLPDLLLQQSISTHKRANYNMTKLLDCLKRMLRKELSRLHWPPPIASPGQSAAGSPSPVANGFFAPLTSKATPPPFGGNAVSAQWQGFAAAEPSTLQHLVQMLSIMTAFQRSVQQSSFEEALKPDSKEDAPELWAMTALTEPILGKLYYHFVEDPQTNQVNHPEWLFHFAEKTVRNLAAETAPLASFLAVHGLQKIYHLPFEFARSLRTGVQAILKDHHLPVMLAEGSEILWLNFAEKALEFEKKMAPLMGSKAEAKGPLARYPWRSGSCFETICSVKEWREAWWQAERSEAFTQVDAAVQSKDAWRATHLVRGHLLAEDLDDDSGGNKSAYQCAVWPTLIADMLLESIEKVAEKTGILPDSMIKDFFEATAQKMMKDVRKLMMNELKRLKEFSAELTSEGLSEVGGILCSAHYLETSIQDPASKLIVFDSGDIDDNESPRLILGEADAFARISHRGTLQTAERIAVAFKKDASQYFSTRNHPFFSQPSFPSSRPEYPSQLLQRPTQMLQHYLETLSLNVDSDIFRRACKTIAEVLNRLFYNALVMEAQFSIQGGQQLELDIQHVSSVFLPYNPRAQIFFRECFDAAKVLSVDEETANEAARCIGRDQTTMPALLQDLGIKIKVDKVVFVLAQRA